MNIGDDIKSKVTGLLLATASFLLWEYIKIRRQLHKFEEAYWSERRGRARVEREMKRISEIQLSTQNGFFVQTIGCIQSCYRQCIGTPRQGMLVPSSRASLTLTSNVSPEALVGLEEFSHVWLTFKFHLNTNTLKESKAFTSRSTFNAKITLPMLKKKMGVFATRSPHRPNPFGVTLAQIERVDKKNRTIYLKACDLVDGTPILDIKPYVPAYDTVPQYRIPEWIAETVYTRNVVTVNQSCVDYVRTIQGKLLQYRNEPDEYMKGLVETLEAEVRSKFQTTKRMHESAQGQPVEVSFDETVVKFHWLEERSFQVVEILHVHSHAARLKELEMLADSTQTKEEEDGGGEVELELDEQDFTAL